MKSFPRTLACVAVAALAGCGVLKHKVLTAPQISGTVTRAGVPVAGLHVQLADALDDAGDAVSDAVKDDAVTNAQGHFSVGPLHRKKRTWSVPLFNVAQHTVPWGLRLSKDGQAWQAGWLSDPTLFGEVPKAPISALCELTVHGKSSVIDGDIAIVGNGPCLLQLVQAKKKK